MCALNYDPPGIDLPDDDLFPFQKLGRAVAMFNTLEQRLSAVAAALVAPWGAVTNAVVSDMTASQIISLAERTATYGVVAPPLSEEFPLIVSEARKLNQIRNRWVHSEILPTYVPMMLNPRQAMRATGGKVETVSDEDFDDFFNRCDSLARRCSEFVYDHRGWWKDNPPKQSIFDM